MMIFQTQKISFKRPNNIIRNLSQGHFNKFYKPTIDSLHPKLRQSYSRKQKMFNGDSIRIYKCFSPAKKTRKIQCNKKCTIVEDPQLSQVNYEEIESREQIIKTAVEPKYYAQKENFNYKQTEALVIKDFQDDGQMKHQYHRQNYPIQPTTQKLQFRTKILKIANKNKQQVPEMNKIEQNNKHLLQYEQNKIKICDAVSTKIKDETVSNNQELIDFNILLKKVKGRKYQQKNVINDNKVKQQIKQDIQIIDKYQSLQIYTKIRNQYKINENLQVQRYKSATNNDNKTKQNIIQDGLLKVKSYVLSPLKFKAKPIKSAKISQKIKLNKFFKDEKIEGW